MFSSFLFCLRCLVPNLLTCPSLNLPHNSRCLSLFPVFATSPLELSHILHRFFFIIFDVFLFPLSLRRFLPKFSRVLHRIPFIIFKVLHYTYVVTHFYSFVRYIESSCTLSSFLFFTNPFRFFTSTVFVFNFSSIYQSLIYFPATLA